VDQTPVTFRAALERSGNQIYDAATT
jgi:hypothetical protein